MGTIADVYLEVRKSHSRIYIYSTDDDIQAFKGVSLVANKLINKFKDVVHKTKTTTIVGCATIELSYDNTVEDLQPMLDRLENAFGVDVTIS